MKTSYIVLLILFVILFSAFIFFVKSGVDGDIVSEIVLASVFFFAFFLGYFITRQNERYTKITGLIAARDGGFSYLYRISGLVPRIQAEVREIIRSHYKKILENNDWAYHEYNPSTTISKLTSAFGSLTNEEGSQIKVSTSYVGIWITIQELQKIRKNLILLCKEKISTTHWVLIFILAVSLIISFALLHSDSLLVSVMKIGFGTVVFLILILLQQLDDLSIFGKDFSREIAGDVLRILDEVDVKELERGHR